MRKKKGRGRFIFFCLAPAVFLFAIFMIYPTIGVFRMSMYKWGGYTSEKTFVGLDNFKTLFQCFNTMANGGRGRSVRLHFR